MHLQKVIGREFPQNSLAHTYKDAGTGVALNILPMNNGGTEQLGSWLSKQMVNGLLARLPVFRGSEVNNVGQGYRCYKIDGSLYQPVVLGDHIITTDSGVSDGAIDVTVLNGTPIYTYRLKETNDTLITEQGTSLFSALAAGDYKIEVEDSLNIIRYETITIPSA